MHRLAALLAVGLTSFIVAPYPCAAQAWLPVKGEGTFSISFQRVYTDGHFLEDGSKLPGYRTEARNAIVDLTYGITDSLSLSFTVPFVNVKYLGPEEPFNLPDNVLDDGTYQGAITDLGFQFRYNLVESPLVVTPFYPMLQSRDAQAPVPFHLVNYPVSAFFWLREVERNVGKEQTLPELAHITNRFRGSALEVQEAYITYLGEAEVQAPEGRVKGHHFRFATLEDGTTPPSSTGPMAISSPCA